MRKTEAQRGRGTSQGLLRTWTAALEFLPRFDTRPAHILLSSKNQKKRGPDPLVMVREPSLSPRAMNMEAPTHHMGGPSADRGWGKDDKWEKVQEQ